MRLSILKTKNFLKQFLSTKINFVSSQLLSTEKSSDDSILIADIYYDSGVERSVFAKLYLETAKRYFSKIKNRPSEEEVFSKIKKGMRLRRYRYLPDGVLAEEVHGLRDVWTFATFLAGLLFSSEGEECERTLKKILDQQVVSWLVQKDVWKTLIALNQIDSVDPNVLALKSFYLEVIEVASVEIPVREEVLQVRPEIGTVEISKPTNREVGELCLHWLLQHASEAGRVAYLQEGKLIVKSPMGFIEFAKSSGFTWKSAQKGLIKLGKHEVNEDGTPFHKIGSSNVLVINQ